MQVLLKNKKNFGKHARLTKTLLIPQWYSDWKNKASSYLYQAFGLISLFNGMLIFNAKTLFVEKQ